MIDKKFKIANKIFKSRLIVGTGKYKNFSECAKAIKTSGADIVTVAVRRVNISDKNQVEMPIVDSLYKIIYKGDSLDGTIQNVLGQDMIKDVEFVK